MTDRKGFRLINGGNETPDETPETPTDVPDHTEVKQFDSTEEYVIWLIEKVRSCQTVLSKLYDGIEKYGDEEFKNAMTPIFLECSAILSGKTKE